MRACQVFVRKQHPETLACSGRSVRRHLLLGATALTLPLLASLPVAAATFTAVNTNDAGAGSIRDAIDQANGAGGADIATFDDGLGGGTVNLLTALDVTDDLTISADASPITIENGGMSTFVVEGSGAAGSFTLGEGLTLSSTSMAGGGGLQWIVPDANLTINGDIDASGFVASGIVSLAADTNATINGSVTANGPQSKGVEGNFASVTVNGSVVASGFGGVGVATRNLTGTSIVVGGNGRVEGQLDAIQWQNGNTTNVLELHAGATIIGVVRETRGNANEVETPVGSTIALSEEGNTNILRFGGAESGSFDVSLVGEGLQFQDFTDLEKTGTSMWTLTGTGTFDGPVTVSEGTLAVDGSLADASSSSPARASWAGRERPAA